MKSSFKWLTFATLATVGLGSQLSRGGDQPSWQVSGSPNLQSVIASIQDAEYEIVWQDHVPAFQSPNRANNLRFSYYDNGFASQRRVQDTDVDSWAVDLRVLWFGRGNAPAAIDKGQITAVGRSARAVHNGITIDYWNDTNGMRQSFVIDRAHGNGSLRIAVLATLDAAEMTTDGSGQAIVFVGKSGELMRYTDLNTWDSVGKVLPSHFEIVGENRFDIVVQDANAVYPITVDPLSTSAFWSSGGENQTGAQFGFSVAYGNFNGAVGDIIVGAPYFDAGYVDEGKVYVFYGNDRNSGMATNANWTAHGDSQGALFGYSVSAGDVDGNGYDDLIVGAQNYGGTAPGAVFAWLSGNSGTGLPGSSGKPGNESWSKLGSAAGSGFGTSIATGDFNGDGKQDLIVGAPFEGSSGKVYVFNGSASGPSTTASWTATCGSSGANFGWSVSCPGNLTCHAVGQDIAIGAPLYGGNGAVFIWQGGSTGLTPNPGTSLNTARLLQISGSSSKFGYSVAGGDVNGDSYSDLLVGAPNFSNGSYTGEGAAFVYFGSSSIPFSSGWSQESKQAAAQFGFAVACGDLNGDGVADIAVGAPFYDRSPTVDGGITSVWYGVQGSSPPQAADWTAFSIQNNANSGASVAIGKNLNYLIHQGIIIGAPKDTLGTSGAKGSVIAFTD